MNIVNVPNCLSVFRILLIPVFIVLYFNGNNGDIYIYMSAVVLLVSGFTDVLDGYIARRYNQTSKIGQFLDPLADKLTQAAVLICLTIKGGIYIIFVSLFFMKELLVLLFSSVFYKKVKVMVAPKWYGKLSTALIYLCVLVILFFGNIISPFYQNIMLAATISWLMISFVLYMVYYYSYYKSLKSKEAADSACAL